MKSKEIKDRLKNQILKTIQIQNNLVSKNDLFDPITKDAIINFGNYWNKRLDNENFTLTGLKSITSDILTYWKESIGIATELFWNELKNNNIEFQRKDELSFALEKGRFRRVDIGIGARKNWAIIKDFDTIQERFSKDDIESLTNIVEKDEKARIEILKKYLIKKKISNHQYLKFGECMAYVSKCGLWDSYFTKTEMEELYDIWNNYNINNEKDEEDL